MSSKALRKDKEASTKEPPFLQMDLNVASLANLLQAVAHEIRTPLTALKAYAQLMEMNLDGNSKIKQYLDQLLQSCAALERDTLPLEALLRRVNETGPSLIDINALIPELWAEKQPQRRTLDFHPGGEGTVTVWGNQTQVRNVILLIMQCVMSRSEIGKVELWTESGNSHETYILFDAAAFKDSQVATEERFKMQDLLCPFELTSILLRITTHHLRGSITLDESDDGQQRVRISFPSQGSNE
jgi:hypothetical protein